MAALLGMGCGRTVDVPFGSVDAASGSGGGAGASSTRDAWMGELSSFDASSIEVGKDTGETSDVSVSDGSAEDGGLAAGDGGSETEVDGSCGACRGQVCVHGHCRDSCDPTFSYPCIFGRKCCPLDPSDASYARGYCTQESNGEICVGEDGGGCAPPLSVCPPGPGGFEPVCVDLLADSRHCGTCAIQCAEPKGSCMAGACVCLAGSICGGVCTNTTTDTTNCGACGNACAVVGQTCVASTCTCPKDRPNACNGACTDLRSDPAHCGDCSQACPGAAPQCLDGACAAAPEVLVTGQNMPLNLVVDSTSIYWVNRNAAGSVRKIPLSGGSPVELASDRTYPDQLVSDGQTLYWDEWTMGIASIPVGGGSPKRLSDRTTFALAVRGSTLFFSAGISPGIGEQNENIFSIPASGGAETQLTCCWADPRNALTVDGTYVYFGANQSTIQRGIIGSSPVDSTTFVSGVKEPVSMTVDGTTLYWLSYDTSVHAAPLSGGAPTVVAEDSSFPTSFNSFLVVSSGYAYWTDSSNPGAVRKAPVNGGRVTTVANHQDTPAGIAVDGQYVYWVTYNAAGAVLRAPR
jgi:hypothetical protein